MKIVHLLKHGVRGNGHVHVAVDLACTQADAGHEVVLACARGSYDALLAAHGVQVVELPEPLGPREALRHTIALLALCRRFRPDVLHAHMMSSAALAFPISKIVRAALVTTMHNSFDGHSVIMRLGRVVIAVSEAERQLLLRRGYRAHKVVTVLNGADGSPREALEPDPLPPLARPCVLTLSGLHPRKAVGDVITAFSHVQPDFPQWHLNIVGWGAERERLEALVQELDLQKSVHFLGSTRTPRPVLEDAEIFTLASLADPCPLTVTEARAAGCAIVGTRVGGIPELLEYGRAGQLVPPSDPPAIAAAFRTLMADEDVLARWRERAKQGAEYFTVARMTEDNLRVYARVTGLPVTTGQV